MENKNTIIFQGIRGSKAYGTYIEGVSDIDTISIHIEPLDNVLSNTVVPQYQDSKGDNVSYEIFRFIELLSKSNINCIETLFLPDDCILYKHPIMDILFENRDKFLTKKLCKSTINYAYAQINKSKGQEKMMNWEKERIKRKNILEFMYVPYEQGSILVTEYLKLFNLKQEYIGIINVDHIRNGFACFYDETEGNKKYKGICKNIETSNDISLSSIPKGEKPLFTLFFNRDQYSIHCKDFKNYQTYLKERNKNRYITVENANRNKEEQKIDSKNLMHCSRLLSLCIEILNGEGVNVFRKDYKHLLDIRAGKYDLNKLIDDSNEKIKNLDELTEKSYLPDSVESTFINNLLIDIRKKFYNLK